MIRLRLSLVSEKSYNRLSCGFISLKKTLFVVGVGIQRVQCQ